MRNSLARIERIVWSDIRASVAQDGDGEGGSLIDVRAVDGGGLIELTDCLVEKVTVALAPPAKIAGSAASDPGLSIRNVRYSTRSP